MNQSTAAVGRFLFMIRDLFPIILIILDVCAATVYLFCGDKVRVAFG